MFQLETDRLLLRRLTMGDLDWLYPIYTDPEVMRFMGGPIRSIDELRAYLEKHFDKYPSDDDHGFCATILKDTGEAIGRVGLLRQEVDDTIETEIGYLIARSHWGRGFATEAARAFRDYALEKLGRRRIISIIVPDNIASQKVALKNGMTHEKDTTWRGMAVRIYSLERDAES